MVFCFAKWAFRLIRPRRLGPTAHAASRAVRLGACGLLAVAMGCASGPKGADRSAGWYDSDSLATFAAETARDYRIAPQDEYVIGVGDAMDVVFLYHTNLTTRELVVRRDGRISLPYVGDQMAAGVTPMTLDSVLTVRFAEILRDPNISVIVTKAAPQKVFVLGEVNSPGAFEVKDEVSVLQSVALAGGFTKEALPRHAVLIRRQGVSKIVGVEIDLQAIMDGSAMANDIVLRNYDVLLLPRHPIYSAADFVKAATSIIGAPLDIVFKGWQIANLSASYEFFQNTTGQR
jgi:polysaccharide export outer membrane protein